MSRRGERERVMSQFEERWSPGSEKKKIHYRPDRGAKGYSCGGMSWEGKRGSGLSETCSDKTGTKGERGKRGEHLSRTKTCERSPNRELIQPPARWSHKNDENTPKARGSVSVRSGPLRRKRRVAPRKDIKKGEAGGAKYAFFRVSGERGRTTTSLRIRRHGGETRG